MYGCSATQFYVRRGISHFSVEEEEGKSDQGGGGGGGRLVCDLLPHPVERENCTNRPAL